MAGVEVHYDTVTSELKAWIASVLSTISFLKISNAGSGNTAIEFTRTGGTPSDWIVGAFPGTSDLGFFSGAIRASLDISGNLTLSNSLIAGSVVVIGANPALSGTIRIPNNTNGLVSRNAANSADIGILTVNAADQIVFGLANSGDILFNPANTEQFRAKSGIGLQLVAGAFFYWNGRAVTFSPADAQITFTNFAGTSGFGIQMGTADTIIVANQAQNAYGTVDCLGLKASGTPGFNGTKTPPASITVVNGIVTNVT